MLRVTSVGFSDSRVTFTGYLLCLNRDPPSSRRVDCPRHSMGCAKYSTDGVGAKAASTGRQGNRVLTFEYFKEVIFPPAGLQAFPLDSHLQAGFPFQHVVEMFRRVARFWGPWSLRTRHWSSRKVTSRLQCREFFDAPVGSHRGQQPLCRHVQAADEVAGLYRNARLRFPSPHHLHHRAQSRPLFTGAQVVQTVGGADDPAFPSFPASVVLVQGGGIVIGHTLKACCFSFLKQVFQVLVQVSLVLFHRQHVVGPTGPEPSGQSPSGTPWRQW